MASHNNCDITNYYYIRVNAEDFVLDHHKANQTRYFPLSRSLSLSPLTRSLTSLPLSVSTFFPPWMWILGDVEENETSPSLLITLSCLHYLSLI